MNLQIGVKILIRNRQQQFLFIKRTKLLQNETEESWDIPGGRIEPEEALDAALAREVQEELGIALTGTPQLINAQDIFAPAKDLHVVRLTYPLDTDVDVSTITLSDEHQAITWLSLTDARATITEPFCLKHLPINHHEQS